jgi:V/A-type H+-transporting ATPase subunit E
MAYENLLKSVEESAQEKEGDLREKARTAVQQISEDAKNQVTMIQQSLLAEAKKAATVEKNKLLYLTKGENKEKLIKTKEAIFSTAIEAAGQRLSHMRKDPKYPEILKNLTIEAVGAVGGDAFRIHIDKRDANLIKKILFELNLSGEIVEDLLCSGGLVVSARNESINISNTLESRLDRVKEQKKLQIYSILHGD